MQNTMYILTPPPPPQTDIYIQVGPLHSSKCTYNVIVHALPLYVHVVLAEATAIVIVIGVYFHELENNG